MADKIIGLRIQVSGTEDITKRLTSLNVELAQAKKEAADLQKSIKDAVNKGNTKDAELYSQQLLVAQERQANLSKESKTLKRELDLQRQAFRAAATQGDDSYEALDTRLKLLRSQFKGLSKDAQDSDFGRELNQEINQLNDTLVKTDAKLGIFTRSVGNYEEKVIQALRRAGNEKQLLKRLDEVNAQTDDLIASSRRLTSQLEKADKNTDVSNTVKELAKIEAQIERNTKEAKQLNAALGDSENLGKQGAKVSGRDIRNIGKAGGKGFGAAAGVAGGLFQGAEAASSFGVAGVAAFGIFAAGGLAFKAIDALDQLSKEFQKLEGNTAAFSGASGLALKGLTVDVKATADTFGKDQDEILKTTKALSKSLGVDFATALDMVQKGLLTGADASGELLATLEGSAEAARAAGLSIDDLIVFSNEATKSGLLSDRGIELVNTFGTAIKTNSGEAKAALTDALGAEFTDKIFKGVADGTITTKDAIQQVSTELTKQGVSAEEASKVFVSAFGAQTAAENDFVLGLKDAGAGVDAYINKANNLTRTQTEQLKANKALASAQQGLATTFESFGFSFSNTLTKVQAGLLNFTNKVILGFNAVFGTGLAAGREGLRKTTEALSEQNKVVTDLERNTTPLLKRYDELTALLPTLAEGSTEAQAAQAELAKVIQAVGEQVPTAANEFDKYNRTLGINADAAKKFVVQQKEIQKNLEEAQTREAVAQRQRLQQESERLQQIAITRQKDVEFGLKDLVSPINAVFTATKKLSGTKLAVDDKELIAANAELQKLGTELQQIDALLKTTASGRAALGVTVADGVSSVLSAAVQGNKKLGEEAAKFNSEEAQKRASEAAAAAKAAAERRKAEREKLIEDEKNTREQLTSAKLETDKAITSLGVQGIEDRAAREAEALKLTFADRIESETKALSDASMKRIEVLGKLAKEAQSDAAIRSQFGTPEQIAAQANTLAEETTARIKEQTALIISERDKQLAALAESRQKTIREAVQSLDAEVVQGALQELQSQLAGSQGELQSLQLQFSLDESQIDAQANLAKSRLAVLRSSNLISERDYQAQVTAIDEQAQAERLNLKAQQYEQETVLRMQQAEQEKLILQGEGIAAQQQFDQQLVSRKETLKQQLDEQLITTEQYNEGVAFAEETTAAQKVLLAQNTAQQIAAIDENLNAERIMSEQDLAQQQADLFVERLANYKEQQMALLQEFAAGLQGVGTFILDAAKATDDFFSASEARRRQDIEARYAAETAGAQGNAGRLAQIERQKAAELARIEQQAATRRRIIAIGEATINGALAITNILATTPDPTGILTAIRIGGAVATTAAQIAVISSQQFEDGGTIPQGDGFISGRSHRQGGVKGIVSGTPIEAEGGEFIGTDEFGMRNIINKQSSRIFKADLQSMAGKKFAGKRGIMSAINSYKGFGVQFAAGGTIAPIPPQTQQEQAAAVATDSAILKALVLEQGAIIRSMASWISNLTVVVNSSDVLEEGAKQQAIKKVQTL